MTDINETIRLAIEGATVISDAVHGKNPTVTACLSQAAAIRSLIALHTGTCEWKVSVYGYDTGCGHRDVLKMDGSEWCAFCGKRLTETHFAAKQEQGKKERT